MKRYLPNLTKSRHGVWYYRIHTSCMDTRVSLGTKDLDRAIILASEIHIHRFGKMNESDKLKAKIQDRLNLHTHLGIAKDSPEYATLLRSLGLPDLIPNPKTLRVIESQRDTESLKEDIHKAITVAINSLSNTVNKVHQAVSTLGTGTGAIPKVTPLLSEVIAKYLEDQSSGDNTEKTLGEKKGACKRFLECIGDKPIGDVTRVDIAKYAKSRSDSAPSTVRKDKVFGMGLFDFARVNLGVIEQNYFNDMYVKGDKSKLKPTEIFSEDEFKALFNPSLYCVDNRLSLTDAGKYWVLPILYTSGARVDEVCQLLISDIKQDENDTWYFHITDEGVKKGTKSTKSIKTDVSKRLVPIHDSILKLGFLEYLNIRSQSSQASDLLFADCKFVGQSGKHNRRVSEYFDSLREAIFGKDYKKTNKTLRGFRSNFITLTTGSAFDMNLRYKVVGQTPGFTPDTQTKHYLKARPTQLKIEIIDKFDASVLDPLIHIIKAP